MQHPCQSGNERLSRFSIRRLWGPVSLMVVISLFSGTPGVQLGEWSFIGIDKLGHLLVFGLLGVAWLRVLMAQAGTHFQALVLAVALTTAFGAFDELHQYLNPDRYFEWADLLADFSGALLAGTLYWRWSLFRSVLEVKIRPPAILRSSD
ncbi:MAG: VanZ family protein [Puniceicoccaceae bacterium]